MPAYDLSLDHHHDRIQNCPRFSNKKTKLWFKSLYQWLSWSAKKCEPGLHQHLGCSRHAQGDCLSKKVLWELCCSQCMEPAIPMQYSSRVLINNRHSMLCQKNNWQPALKTQYKHVTEVSQSHEKLLDWALMIERNHLSPSNFNDEEGLYQLKTKSWRRGQSGWPLVV